MGPLLELIWKGYLVKQTLYSNLKKYYVLTDMRLDINMKYIYIFY